MIDKITKTSTHSKRVAEKLNEKLKNINLERAKFYPYFINKYRKENDGRILTFNPVTRRICVMNPTMGIIYEGILQKEGISFRELLNSLTNKFSTVSEEILKKDLARTLLWLLLNGFISIKFSENEINIASLSKEIVEDTA